MWLESEINGFDKYYHLQNRRECDNFYCSLVKIYGHLEKRVLEAHEISIFFVFALSNKMLLTINVRWANDETFWRPFVNCNANVGYIETANGSLPG